MRHKTQEAVPLAWKVPLHFKGAYLLLFFHTTDPQRENKETKVHIARQLMGLPKLVSLLLGGAADGYLCDLVAHNTITPGRLTTSVLFFAVFSVASHQNEVKWS